MVFIMFQILSSINNDIYVNKVPIISLSWKFVHQKISTVLIVLYQRILIYRHQGGPLILHSNQCQDPPMWHLDTWSPAYARVKAIELGGSGDWLPGLALPLTTSLVLGIFTIMINEMKGLDQVITKVSFSSWFLWIFTNKVSLRSNQLILFFFFLTSLIFILSPHCHGERWAFYSTVFPQILTGTHIETRFTW